jgi:hypothetical protein
MWTLLLFPSHPLAAINGVINRRHGIPGSVAVLLVNVATSTCCNIVLIPLDRKFYFLHISEDLYENVMSLWLPYHVIIMSQTDIFRSASDSYICQHLGALYNR